MDIFQTLCDRLVDRKSTTIVREIEPRMTRWAGPQWKLESSFTRPTATMKRLLLIALFALLLAPTSFAQTAEELFQQATQKERVEGDLNGAIALFERVVDSSSDRNLTARALLKIGENYERLGRDNATEAYQRIVDQFADQTSELTVAERRLALMAEPTMVSRSRTAAPGTIETVLLETGRFLEPMPWYGSSVSPDGRLVARVPRGSNAVYVYDQVTSEVDSLNYDSEDCWSYTTRFSPDGRKVAYVCFESRNTSLRVFDLEQRKETRLLDGVAYFDFGPDSSGEFEVHDWTQDGQAILISAQSHPSDSVYADHLLTVNLDGSVRELYDPAYGDNQFWEEEACLLHDDKIMLAHYGWEYASIFALTANAGTRKPVFSSEGTSYRVFDCLKESNTLIYSATFKGSSAAGLYRAHILPNGEAIDSQLLANIPENAWPIPGARNGDVFFGLNNNDQSVVIGDISEDLQTIVNLQKLDFDQWVTIAHWSPSRNKLLGQSGGRRLIVFDEPKQGSKADTLRRVEPWIGKPVWSPDEKKLMSSFPWDRDGGWFNGTTIHSLTDGSVVDQVGELGGIDWTEDGGGMFFASKTEPETCLNLFDWKSKERRVLFCSARDLTINPYRWAVSPDREAFAVQYGETPEGPYSVFVFDTTGSVIHDYKTTADQWRANFKWSSDGLKLIFQGFQTKVLSVLDLESGDIKSAKLDRLLPMELRGFDLDISRMKIALTGNLSFTTSLDLKVLRQHPDLVATK